MFNKQNPLYQEDLKYIFQTKGKEQFCGKRFLITGATGLIGLHLIDALMKLNDVSIYAVGRSKVKAAERLGEYYDTKNFQFVELDINNAFPDNLSVDYIIPLASNTHPVAYAKYPIETMLTNLKGAIHALDLACLCKATVLYPSTVEIYGNARGEDVFTENYTGVLNLSNSRACYTESKRACEALCQSYASERGVNVIIARLSRIFGPTMLSTDTKASSQFINKAIAGEDIVLKSDGEQLFSYTYASDAVAAILHILLHGERGEIYNISCDSCNVRLKDFASECATFAKKKVVFDLPDENERKGYSIAMKAVLDNTKLKSIGFTANYSYKKGIARTISILKTDKHML